MPKITSKKSHGQPSQSNLPKHPRITLRLYDGYATITRMMDNRSEIMVEYAIDPSQLGSLLATNLALHSGFLPPDIVWISKRMDAGAIASYRPPQQTGIWLEGTEIALRVPMPGLILIQDLPENSGTSKLFAVKELPYQHVQLFAAPLPNVSEHSGWICWGTVAKAKLGPESPNDLTPIWTRLFGSAFVNHDLGNKSKRYPGDIRRVLIELDNAAPKEYPLDDLQPTLNTRGDPRTLNDIMTERNL